MAKAKLKAQVQRAEIKSVEAREKCWVLFIDFAKAFDSVDRQILLNKLENKNIPAYLTHIMAAFLSGTKCSINNELIHTNIGIPQGTALSPYGWLCLIDDLLVALRTHGLVNTMCFADDLAICTDNLSQLE